MCRFKLYFQENYTEQPTICIRKVTSYTGNEIREVTIITKKGSIFIRKKSVNMVNFANDYTIFPIFHFK